MPARPPLTGEKTHQTAKLACPICQSPARKSQPFCNGCGHHLTALAAALLATGPALESMPLTPSLYRLQTLISRRKQLFPWLKPPSPFLFQQPTGLALDRHQNLYVADTLNHCIRKVTAGGIVSTLAGHSDPGWRDAPGARARFNKPLGLAMDGEQNLYVMDSGNSRLRKVSPDGLVASLPVPGQPYGALVAALDSTLYFFNRLTLFGRTCHCLCRYDGAGELAILVKAGELYKWQPYQPGDDSRPLNPWSPYREQRPVPLSFPDKGLRHNALALDSKDSLYFTESHRILKLSAGGELTLVAGNEAGYTDGSGHRARFSKPLGLAVDRQGMLYVADTFNHCIRQITPDNSVTTLAGPLAREFEVLHQPTSLVAAPDGTLYIADTGNWRLCALTLYPAAAPPLADSWPGRLKQGVTRLVSNLGPFFKPKPPVEMGTWPGRLPSISEAGQLLQGSNRTAKLEFLHHLIRQGQAPLRPSLTELEALFSQILQDRDTSVRVLLVKEICTLMRDEPEALMWLSLLAKLQEPNRLLKKYCIQILDYIGKTYALYGNAVPLLVDLMKDPEADVSQAAGEQLKKIRAEGYESLIDPLLEELSR